MHLLLAKFHFLITSSLSSASSFLFFSFKLFSVAQKTVFSKYDHRYVNSEVVTRVSLVHFLYSRPLSVVVMLSRVEAFTQIA